jgi:hypothetical protein
MRFFAFSLCFLVLIGGLALGTMESGAPHLWVMIGCIILLGIRIATGSGRTRVCRPNRDIIMGWGMTIFEPSLE